MTKYKYVNKRMYFVFNHNEAYQKMHRAYLAKYARASTSELLMGLEEARRNMHVEALLEVRHKPINILLNAMEYIHWLICTL